jgi:cyclophilin family peptidyl-prolyl cis-trans isomerase
VDRLYQLIQSGFYHDMALFRVVPGFVVQFGISNDSTLNKFWESDSIPDEPVIKKNTKGTVSFARDGQHTRSIQIFINLGDNSPRLDTIFYGGVLGFPGIAEVTEGMDVVQSFYWKYGNKLGRKQDSIYAHGNDFLRRNYPEIDYIIKSYIIEN